MGLVGCLVTPHPPIIVPEVGGGRTAKVEATVRAMVQLGEETRALRPDVLVVISPHSPLDVRQMSVLLARSWRGSLAPFGAAGVRVELEGDRELSLAILGRARTHGVAAGVMGPPGPPDQAEGELDHGVVVPLSFLVRELPVAPRLVCLSFSHLNLEAHLRFGKAVEEAIEATSARAVFVASGDLSHRLLPGAPAGYHPAATEFDQRVVQAFEKGNQDLLLSIPASLRHSAGECGYRSLVVLFGLLQGKSFRTRLLSYEGPFGVGYLVGAVDLLTPRGEDHGSSREAEEKDKNKEKEEVHPILALARRAVESYVRDGVVVEPALPPGTEPGRAGVFVSLHGPGNQLRGCLGTFRPTKSTLAEEIVSNAVSAATRDPRFPPVQVHELGRLHVSVDVLADPEEVDGPDQLDPRRYGIIVRTDDGRQAILLPDLEGVDTCEQQLRLTCRKGGIDPAVDSYSVCRFEVKRYG